MGLIKQINVEGARNDIETDGNTYTGPRNVPGQASVYVHPGDARKEPYRLSTFCRFPASTTPVLPAPLARSGFFYTGYKDRVKCFSCELSVENWAQGDDVSDKKWHLTDCEFANGRNTTNIPSLGAYKNELEKRWPVRNEFHIPHVATNIHAQGTSSPGSFLNIPTPAQDQSAEPRSISPAIQKNQDRYPCLHPVNPHMRSAVSRLESFKERNGIRWPRERLRAGIDDLVNAGFFYLGDRDRVKCWYCNGRLQNWDYDDDPWTEHAKWFPNCQYLLRVNGHRFVNGVVAQDPDLQRPIPTALYVESDASGFRTDINTSTEVRDAPEEASVYVYPGDTRKEAYRLSTFHRFPDSTPVQPALLARSGFFYTGYRNRVKCFSCGIDAENWMRGDDESDRNWHKTDCEFANGLDTANIPLLAVYRRELEKHRQARNCFCIPQSARIPTRSNAGFH